MRDALKKLTGESVVYGLGQAGGRAVQLLLVPVLTRLLDPGAFGVAELVTAYSQTAALILVFGMDGALARFFYHEPDREARIRMASSSLAFRLAVTTAVSLTIWIFAAPLAAHFVSGEVYRKYIRIGALSLPFTLIVMFGNDVLRVTFQPWKFITLNITQTVLVGGLSLWLVWAHHLGVAGVLYARLFGDAASALLALVLARHTLRPRFSRLALARMLSYGAPTVPAAFAYGAVASVDRFVLQRTRSLEEVAVYAVAIKFFTAVWIGISAFQLAYGPWAFARAHSPDGPRLFARAFGAYMAAAGLVAIAVGAFAPEVLAVLVPEPYRRAAWPAAWLAFAAVAQGSYTVASVGIGIALRTSLLSVGALSAAAASIAGNVLLVPRLGVAGAAIGTFLGYGTSAVVTYRVAQSVHPLPYRGGRLLSIYLLALALGLAAQTWGGHGAAGLVVKIAVMAAFALVCARLALWTERGAVAPSALESERSSP
ncbi:MAG TPA: lipopolysaccharide biosynthesis protein [Candidatus Eisenbacteria bacterium]|jgi:O-antigen/teichoic acid export membrane protein